MLCTVEAVCTLQMACMVLYFIIAKTIESRQNPGKKWQCDYFTWDQPAFTVYTWLPQKEVETPQIHAGFQQALTSMKDLGNQTAWPCWAGPPRWEKAIQTTELSAVVRMPANRGSMYNEELMTEVLKLAFPCRSN